MFVYQMMHYRCSNIPCTNDHDICVGAKVFSAAMIVDCANLFSPVGGNGPGDREIVRAASRGGHIGM